MVDTAEETTFKDKAFESGEDDDDGVQQKGTDSYRRNLVFDRLKVKDDLPVARDLTELLWVPHPLFDNNTRFPAMEITRNSAMTESSIEMKNCTAHSIFIVFICGFVSKNLGRNVQHGRYRHHYFLLLGRRGPIH